MSHINNLFRIPNCLRLVSIYSLVWRTMCKSIVNYFIIIFRQWPKNEDDKKCFFFSFFECSQSFNTIFLPSCEYKMDYKWRHFYTRLVLIILRWREQSCEEIVFYFDIGDCILTILRIVKLFCYIYFITIYISNDHISLDIVLWIILII